VIEHGSKQCELVTANVNDFAAVDEPAVVGGPVGGGVTVGGVVAAGRVVGGDGGLVVGGREVVGGADGRVMNTVVAGVVVGAAVIVVVVVGVAVLDVAVVVPMVASVVVVVVSVASVVASVVVASVVGVGRSAVSEGDAVSTSAVESPSAASWFGRPSQASAAVTVPANSSNVNNCRRRRPGRGIGVGFHSGPRSRARSASERGAPDAGVGSVIRLPLVRRSAKHRGADVDRRSTPPHPTPRP
jgi:hypothetical protein